jgi:glyoxylase-like metal-dependent hydrolase (beta-lactamase superfamily II)
MIVAAPRRGRTSAIAEGIDWLRFPHKTGPRNVWRFAAKDGWDLVDSGHGTSVNEALWTKLLNDEPVAQLILTDSEPGAVGNAEFLTETPVLMTEHHMRWAHYLLRLSPELEHDLRTRFYREHGLGEAEMRILIQSERSYRAAVPYLPRRYRRIADGEVISLGQTEWQVLTADMPGGLSLYAADRQMLITGALNRSVIHASFTEPDEDKVTPWLAVLDRLAALPEATLVLPARGSIFDTLPQQIMRLRQRVAERSSRVMQACRDPVTAAEIAGKLWPAQPIESGFAEAVALLNHLVAAGRVERQRDHGVRFRAIY